MNIVIGGHIGTGFPKGSAHASRIRNMAKGLKELGHNVYVIEITPLKPNSDNQERGVWHDYQGIPYYIAGPYRSERAMRSFLLNLINYYNAFQKGGEEGVKCIESLQEERKIDAFIGLTGYYFGMQELVRYCKSRGVLIVQCVVEWFQPQHYEKGGILAPMFWNDRLHFHCLAPKSDGILAATEFLKEWFVSKGVKTILSPTLVDPEEFTKKLPERAGHRDDTFQLTYLSRSMSWRDTPMVMMKAVQKVLESGLQVFLNIIGVDAKSKYLREAQQYVEKTVQLKDHVRFWGYVAEQQLFELLSVTDAFIFPRLDSRETRSCFPTRLPEFLLSGKPVIASAVGDILVYLIDNKEAIIVKPNSVEALAEGITKLIKLPDHGRTIGLAGKEKCLKCFHYRNRCEQISTFLEEMLSKKSHFVR